MIFDQSKNSKRVLSPGSFQHTLEIPQAGRFKTPTRFLFQPQQIINGRFELALNAAPLVRFSDDQPLIFFSDCHRGDNGVLDRFARNKKLFLHALTHYDRSGFTYVEVGDGDELWHVDRFASIESAHRPVFGLLRRLHREGRLHMVIGNHDMGRDRLLVKQKFGVPQRLGIRFLHQRTGREIFATHGHQADLQPIELSRLLLRYLAKPFQQLAATSAEKTGKIRAWARDLTERIENSYEESSLTLEQRIKQWTQRHPQKFIVCGHTHLARFNNGNYFNTGSCLEPGLLTGIEIQKGEIRQVRWVETKNGEMVRQEIAKIRLDIG